MTEDDSSGKDNDADKQDDNKSKDDKGLEGLQAEMAELREALKGANDEAGKYRRQLRDLTEEKDSGAKKKLEEQNKYKELYEGNEAKLTSFKAKLEKSTIQGKIESLAVKAGIRDIDLVSLIDTSGIVFDEDKLKVHGAQEAVDDFKKSKPFLFGEDEKKVTNPKNGKTSETKSEGDMTPQEMKAEGWTSQQIVDYYKERRGKNTKFATVSRKDK